MEFARHSGGLEIYSSDKRNGSGSCEGTYNLIERITYALDNIRHSAGAMASWVGQFVHARRVHSYPARDRDCGTDHPVAFGPTRIVSSAR
jgi:hypothetical protein